MNQMVFAREEIDQFVSKVKFDASGLVPVIAQQHDTGKVLMLAWMTIEALRQTMQSGDVTYWSRSRQELWRKGATSGHTQSLHTITLDCDGDAILIQVDQIGPACHTGAENCFFVMPGR
ncbi:MAG: phosphoribosyl-AMP cyclohydrolase [Alphaproteobacteria bacterium]